MTAITTAITTIATGNVILSTCTFAPASGHTSAGNVTARVIDPAGTITSLAVVAGATDVYTATATAGDTDPSGYWTVRWECSSPKISEEAIFQVSPSAFGSSA